MTYTTLSPNSFTPVDYQHSAGGAALVVARHDLDLALNSGRRTRRSFRWPRLRLRLAG